MSKVSIQCTRCGRYIQENLADPPLLKKVTCECGNTLAFDAIGLTSRICCNCNTINYFSFKVRSYAICSSCKKTLFSKPVRGDRDFHTCKHCGHTTVFDATDQADFQCPTCEKVSPIGYIQDDSKYKKTDLPSWIRYIALITIDVCLLLAYKALVNTNSLRSFLLWIMLLLLFVGSIGLYILNRKGLLRVKQILSGGYFCAAFCMAFTTYPSIINNKAAYVFLWYVAMLFIALYYFIARFTFSSQTFIVAALLQILLLPAADAVFVGVLLIPIGELGTLWEVIDTLLKVVLAFIVGTFVIVSGIGALVGGAKEYESYAEYGKSTGRGKYIDGKYYETYTNEFGRVTYISSDGKVLREDREGSQIFYDSDGKAYIDNARVPYHDRKD